MYIYIYIYVGICIDVCIYSTVQNIDVYSNIYLYNNVMPIYTYIQYIYIYRERERERCIFCITFKLGKMVLIKLRIDTC